MIAIEIQIRDKISRAEAVEVMVVVAVKKKEEEACETLSAKEV